MDAVSLSRHIAGGGTSAAAWRADPALANVAQVDLAQLVAPGARLVVVAPHPDDEILPCGGLLHLLAQRAALDPDAAAPLVVAVTDGEGSHPGSDDWPQAHLRQVRPAETAAALAALGLTGPPIMRLGIPDGGVSGAEDSLARRLASIIRPGDVVLTTWRHDGHPDHEATARACARACHERGAQLLEAPVWGWHWSSPEQQAMPFARAVKLALPPGVVSRKRAALVCFHSQITADASTGAAPIVPAFAIERIINPFELYFYAA